MTVLFCQASGHSEPFKCREILCYVRPDTPDKQALAYGWTFKANGWNCRVHSQTMAEAIDAAQKAPMRIPEWASADQIPKGDVGRVVGQAWTTTNCAPLPEFLL